MPESFPDPKEQFIVAIGEIKTLEDRRDKLKLLFEAVRPDQPNLVSINGTELVLFGNVNNNLRKFLLTEISHVDTKIIETQFLAFDLQKQIEK